MMIMVIIISVICRVQFI